MQRSSKLRKLLAPILAALLIASIAATAAHSKTGSAPRPTPPGKAPGSPPAKADRDRDKVFDDLEARLGQGSERDRLGAIVVLRDPVSGPLIQGLKRSAGEFEVVDRFHIIDGFAATVEKRQVRALARAGVVAHVQENSVVRAQNDTAQSSFGVTQARVQSPALDGNADGNVNTYSAGDLVAAVIDSGIDRNHQDLDEGKVIAFRDFVNGQTSAYDDDGHGSHVAATIAGEGDARPDRLYKGVAPAAALVGVKVLDQNGNGTEADVVSGIEWVVDNRVTHGIEAINLSLGVAGCSSGTEADSLAVNAAHDAGLVVAVAAGNEGPGTCTVGSPGAASKALTVGAMADMGENGFTQAFFSSRGPTADGRIKPDVSAPGVDITSAAANTTTGYVNHDGTSMATPFVAGVALLMRDANPGLTPQQVKNAITGTAIDWARGGNNQLAGSSGPDIDYGAGRLDAHAAIGSAGAALGTPPDMPAHELRQGTLSGTNAQVDYPLVVKDARFPVAATLIISSILGGGATNPDFDLYLFDPSGAEVASSEFRTRQEELGHEPPTTGTYTLRVKSFRGSGPFFVDVSAGLRTPYPVPAAASPITVSLVPAFRQTISEGQCSATGRAPSLHGSPLDFPSCNPPGYAPGTAARLGPAGTGSAQLTVIPGNLATPADEADLSLALNATDVRSAATGSDYVPNPSGPDVTLIAKLRLTDTLNGAAAKDPATVTDFDFPVPVGCTSTPGPEGATCSASTTADALTPGTIKEGKSAVLQTFRLRVEDSGANGVRGDSDDRLFAQQGLYSP